MKSGYILLALAILGLPACGGPATAPAAPGEAAVAGPAEGSLEWAAAGSWRLEKEKARDQYRHPVETLKFFGVKPTDTVVEIAPGGGWYTAILGPYLKKGGGKLYAAQVDPMTSDYAQAERRQLHGGLHRPSRDLWRHHAHHRLAHQRRPCARWLG